MRTPRVVDGLVGVAGPERLPVQDRQVIEVEIAVVGHLPVRTVDGLAAHVGTARELVMGQHLAVAAEVGVDVEGRPRRQGAEDNAGSLGDGQRREAMTVGVEVAEFLTVEDPDQPALAVVAPRVVRAGEAPCRAGSLRHDDRAAVAAHVHE